MNETELAEIRKRWAEPWIPVPFFGTAQRDVAILLAEVERLQSELDKWQHTNTAAHNLAAQW